DRGAVDTEIELARVARWRADLVHGQGGLVRIRDRADLVVARSQGHVALGVAGAAEDRREVVAERGVRARGLTHGVGAGAGHHWSGRPGAGRVRTRPGGRTVDLQVELAGVGRWHAELVHRQRRVAGVRDRAGLVVAGGEGHV